MSLIKPIGEIKKVTEECQHNNSGVVLLNRNLKCPSSTAKATGGFTLPQNNCTSIVQSLTLMNISLLTVRNLEKYQFSSDSSVFNLLCISLTSFFCKLPGFREPATSRRQECGPRKEGRCGGGS